MVLRETIGRKGETLTGRWRTFHLTSENEISVACEVFGRNEIIPTFFLMKI